MASTANYLDPQVLAELEGLSLRTRNVIAGYLSGAHRSAHPGSSADFSQHRPYSPGDDPRRVDWKAFGRTDRLYVKQFMDETNLASSFLLDASASMNFRGQRSALSKFEYASCVVSALAWLLRDQGDAVGLVICNDAAHDAVPASAADYQLAEIIQAIELTNVQGGHDIGELIRDWAMRQTQRQLLVIVSDLFGSESIIGDALIDLRQFGHEVIVISVGDRDEAEFPFDQPTEFTDLEAGPDMTLDAELYREGYLREYTGFFERIRSRCRRASIDFLPLLTDQSLGRVLGEFLSARARLSTST